MQSRLRGLAALFAAISVAGGRELLAVAQGDVCDGLGYDHVLLQAHRVSLASAGDKAFEPHLYTKRSLTAHQGGNVRSEFGVVNATECAALCDGTEACRSFTYSDWERACHLKDKEVSEDDSAQVPGNWHYSTYMRSGPHGSSAVAVPAPAPQGIHEPAKLEARVYVGRSLVADEGHELLAKKGVTVEECKTLCDQLRGCQSFAFSATQHSCHFKDRHVAGDDQAGDPYIDFQTYMVVDSTEAGEDEGSADELEGGVSPDEVEGEVPAGDEEKEEDGEVSPDDLTREASPDEVEGEGSADDEADDEEEGEDSADDEEEGKVSPSQEDDEMTSDEEEGKVSSEEWEHFQLLNQLRAQGFTCPGGMVFEPNPVAIKLDCRLWKAARLHSEDMAAQGYLAHTSKDGRSPWDRAKQQGVIAGAENVYAGGHSPEGSYGCFLKSGGHCRNMMNPDSKIFGGGVGGDSYPYYWTQMFGPDQGDVDTTCYPSDAVQLVQMHDAAEGATDAAHPEILAEPWSRSPV
mmetsp:Transcript_96172/g.242307  ORF Transcript_96172/g.242307 Transcript_96172/m.242307 type:complete len:518 (+) Transcript_96172:53-1606(+)